jgi:hypothetical protein
MVTIVKKIYQPAVCLYFKSIADIDAHQNLFPVHFSECLGEGDAAKGCLVIVVSGEYQISSSLTLIN